MTFILTAVSVEPLRKPVQPTGEVLLRSVETDERSWARAGYLPGLKRYFDEPIKGDAYHLLVDEGDGYETSNVFMRYAEDDEEPARLSLPEEYRASVEAIVRDLLAASHRRRVLLVIEDNGHVTSPDLTPEEVETIDIVGPISTTEFWRLVDLNEIFEDSIVILDADD